MAGNAKAKLYETILHLIEEDVYDKLNLGHTGGMYQMNSNSNENISFMPKSKSGLVPGKFDLVRGCGTMSLASAIKAANERQILYCNELNKKNIN